MFHVREWVGGAIPNSWFRFLGVIESYQVGLSFSLQEETLLFWESLQTYDFTRTDLHVYDIIRLIAKLNDACTL